MCLGVTLFPVLVPPNRLVTYSSHIACFLKPCARLSAYVLVLYGEIFVVEGLESLR